MAPWCCTPRPKPRRAARWRWWKTATRSSSTWRSAACTSTYPTSSSPSAGRNGRHPSRRSSAVTGAFTSITCCRRTKARISISWSARAARSCLVITTEQEHVLGADGQFHVEDEAVDLAQFGFEDWAAFALFWMMAAVVFYQVFTRYVMDDPAGWTEEIARYFLVAVVFVGAAMSVRKNNHIQVDYFYRLMPAAMGRVLATLVDGVRCVFLGYACWLTWLLLQRIGNQPMAVIDLPVGWVFSAMLFGFLLMFLRSLQVAWRHWRQGYSVLERPEFPEV